MDPEGEEGAGRALRALASMCDASPDRAERGTIPLDWFSWQPLGATSLLWVPTPPQTGEELVKGFLTGSTGSARSAPVLTVDRRLGDRLAALERLRPDQHPLQIGWLFVAGSTVTADGTRRTVFQPLVTRALHVQRELLIGPTALVPVGDVELTSLVADRDQRAHLERSIEWGGGALDSVSGTTISKALLERLHHLRTFAIEAAAAAGYDTRTVIPAGEDPRVLLRRDDVVVVVGVGLFTTTAATGLSPAESLLTWANRPFREPTAFHALYDAAQEVGADVDPSEPVESPFELTPAQRDAVRRSRRATVTVVSGPPGTGKSHTIAAIACDALGRGDTVLMAAKSAATVDALVDLFERAPGPQPIVFGSNERKDALAARLAGGLARSRVGEVHLAGEHLQDAVEERDHQRAWIAERLEAEALLGSPAALDRFRRTWPKLVSGRVDLDEVAHLVERARPATRGWWARRRAKKAARELVEVIGAVARVSISEVGDAVELARVLQSAGGVGTEPVIADGEWDELARAEAAVRTRAGELLELEARSEARYDRLAVGAVSTLATALRSGRAARREQLSRMDRALTHALPLWVGTLADIEDLLPAEAGLFDLVVLDEASSIDQPTAAAALLRGRRAVVVGDPRQLRHVSFVGDDQRDEAVRAAGIDPASFLGARLDVRRNSAFDVAAAAATVLTLDEQFRCDPHLVEFVAHRLYEGQVHVARRTPATESIDCVDVIRVDGKRDKEGVVRAEVKAVLERLRRTPFVPGRTVGVVTPFRAQADALEAAILDALTVDEIEALDLRVGTVHAFQGNERDLIIASLGVGDDGHAASWRFIGDPHLFTVLVTRARSKLVIVHAGEPPAGLVADYLAQADAPPGPPRPRREADAWAAAIAADLASTGVRAISAYPSGRHLVDVAVGDGPGFLGLESEVHPDGADAHIDRHLALRARGWRLQEAFERRWSGRRGELVVELAGEAGARSGADQRG